ncbi:MAG: hypothetical protein R2752_19470 [Vicinamibacterales bacterium]
MPPPTDPNTPLPRPISSSAPRDPKRATCEDAMLCERCGESMFRMHAVWRCPGCGFKTDCCGW